MSRYANWIARSGLALAAFTLAACSQPDDATPSDEATAEAPASGPMTAEEMAAGDQVVAMEGVETINWDDLLPEGEMDRIQELYDSVSMMSGMDHFGGPAMQIGTYNVVQDLVGATIRMPGFILPLEYQEGGMINEFLLVPYFGACIHTPPPPPNQIVYVTMDEPIRVERMWDPVWVIGVLNDERRMNELGNAAYTLRLISHEPYEY